MELMEYIDKHRVAMAIPIREIAIAAEITPDYYTKLVKGISQPSWPVVQKMLKHLNLRLIVTPNDAYNEF